MAPVYEMVATINEGKSKAGYDTSSFTRKICYIGLSISWVLGIGTLTTGAVVLRKNSISSWPVVNVSRTMKELIPLLLNIFVTILTECFGFIHATALRWALQKDLTFNANLRLFTSPKSGPVSLGRLSNLFHAALLVLSYVSTSLVFCSSPPTRLCRQIYREPDYYCAYDEKAVYVSPPALFLLGGSIVGQAIIATCQLVAVKIPSWSSAPVNTAWIQHDTGTIIRRHGRCMMSVHDSKTPSIPVQPRLKQRSAWHAHSEIKRVLIYICILTLLTYTWFASLYIGIVVRHRVVLKEDGECYDCDVYPGTDWSLLPDSRNFTSLVDITNLGEVDPNGPGGAWMMMFLLIFVFQVFITMGLHCAELVVNVSRDEEVWRSLASDKGYMTGTNSILAAMKSWKTVLLLTLKPVVHWVFGMGMAYYYGWGVFMRPPQILYLSFVLTVLATFSTIICRQCPKGPQPATYGHLQTLVDLIDEWYEHMYWGHKGESDSVLHAGTAEVRLPGVVMEGFYS